MSHAFTARTASVLALAISATAASAQINGIFSNIPGANNTVPGGTAVFNVGSTSSSAFDRPYFSPDGNRWIISATQDDPTDDKDLVIIGSGTTGAGASVVAMEDAATPFDAARTWETFDSEMGITNSGQYAFGANISGATTDDEVITVFNGTTQLPVIREGQVSPIAGQNFGTTLDSTHILADGTPRYRAILAPTTTKLILGSGAGTAIGETDVTIPGNQLVAPPQTVDSFATNQFASSFDGTHYVWNGDLNGATTTDGVIVVDGLVVVQEGAPLPGGLFGGVNVGVIATGDKSVQMSPDGTEWAVRIPMADGTGVNATDIVVHNGSIAAKTGDPITPGNSEIWDDTLFAQNFFLNTVDDAGNVVVGGLSNGSDVNKDAVLVYYGAGGNSFVLAREGDPVDLNGNGLFDDNAFIDIFGNDDGVLTNGRYYFVAAIQDVNGTSTGNAFLSIPVPEPSAIALAGAMMLGLRRRRSVLTLRGTTFTRGRAG